MRVRVAGPAASDLESILETSLERWGRVGRERYESLLDAVIRMLELDALGPTTRALNHVRRGLRSLHTRAVRGTHGVKSPVHVFYYRLLDADTVLVLRVLHERQEATLHLDEEA